MAEEIPPGLKQADITIAKCATRANQLQAVDPIMSYWCEYWVVNQILARQLHQTDEDILKYTSTLMDKLEQMKNDYAGNDAVVDDVAGQAYVENFAQKTLDRAERVVKANKVTRQTADTFDAAATFFHLVNIWAAPDQETQQKIKYAKWSALRIAKAIKEGKDPNESNPKQEEAEEEAAPPPLDPNDPEVRMLTSPYNQGVGQAPRPATVEDVPDGGSEVKRDAAGVSLPPSPRSASIPAVSAADDLQLPDAPTADAHRQGASPQPGYFDNHPLPSPLSPPSHNPVTYHAPDPAPPPAAWTPTPPPPPASQAAYPPPSQDQFRPAPAAPAAPPTFAAIPSPTPAVAPPPSISQPPTQNLMDVAPSAHMARPAIPAPGPSPGLYGTVPPPASQATAVAPRGASGAVADELALLKAQKHARWAISALNFEDVNTAVKELRLALQTLGAG